MEILLWLVPPALVTVLAMVWVSWLGRARDVRPDRSEAAQQRLAEAILKDLPGAAAHPARRVRERSTGLAVRPSQVSPARPVVAPDAPDVELDLTRGAGPGLDRELDRPASPPADRRSA